VADPDRALSFYCGVLGFELMQRYGLFKATTELHARLEGTQIDIIRRRLFALLQSTEIQMPPRHALEQPQ